MPAQGERLTAKGGQRRRLSTPERVALIILAGALVACAVASRAHTPDTISTTRVRIGVGDTLWGIAQQNRITGLSTAQTADFIARLNGLDTSTLAPGSELKIPAPAASSKHLASK